MKNSLPKQHGAWSIMIASILVGAMVRCGVNYIHILLLLCGVFIMGLRHNINLWLKHRSAVRLRWMVVYSTLFTIAGTLILWQVPYIIPIGFAGVLLFVITLMCALKKGELNTTTELMGVVTLSLFVLASYLLSCCAYTTEMFIVWIVSLLFFSGSIFRVRYLVRVRMKGRNSVREGIISTVYHTGLFLFILGLCFYYPAHPFYTLAVLPSVVGAYLYPFIKPPQSIHRVGFIEVSYTFVFVTFLVLLPRV